MSRSFFLPEAANVVVVVNVDDDFITASVEQIVQVGKVSARAGSGKKKRSKKRR